MPLQLHKLSSQSEFPALISALDASYLTPPNGFWTGIFRGTTDIDECSSRFASWHAADPTSNWVYVTDTKTGEVAGATQWKLYVKDPYANGGGMRELPAYWIEDVISFCGTHPSYRRRGAGRLMMEWGCKKADEMGLEAFVEATEEGKPLYEAAGFVVVDEMILDAEKDGSLDGLSQGYLDLRHKIGFPMKGYFMYRPEGGRFTKGMKFPWESESG